MSPTADSSVAWASEGKGRRGFYRRVEAVHPHRHGLQGLQHGHEVVATCGGVVGQWGEAVRPPASGHRPRSTDLGLHASVRASSAQWGRHGPRTAGFSDASVCAREPGTTRPTWRRAGDVVRGSAGCTDPFHLAFLQLNFLQIPNRSAPNFEYQICQANCPLQECHKALGWFDQQIEHKLQRNLTENSALVNSDPTP
jgi:hypothetical protein